MLNKFFTLILKLQNVFSLIKEKVLNIRSKIVLLFQYFKEKPKLFTFLILNFLSALLIISCIITFFYNSNKYSNLAITNGQMALINLESDTVIVGQTISEMKKKEIIESEFTKTKEKIENPKLAIEEEKKTKIFKAQPISADSIGKRKIVIVVKNLGLSKAMTLEALQLPRTFTLGFSPYSNDISGWVDQSTSKGFETLLNLPMQPSDYPVNDPGPYAMLQNLSVGENLSRLDWILTRSYKILGVYTEQNETFSKSRSNISPILDELKNKAKVFLYGNLDGGNSLKSLASNIGIPYADVNINIDEELDSEKIMSNLRKLEGLAASKDFVVGYVNPYPISLKCIYAWLSEIDYDSLIVTPLSTALPKQEDPVLKKLNNIQISPQNELPTDTSENESSSEDITDTNEESLSY